METLLLGRILFHTRRECVAGLLSLLAASEMARADDQTSDDETCTAQRPAIMFNRWQEDWSVLSNPACRTEPFDNFKYIPLSLTDPMSYVSLGMGLRERYENLNAPSFGVPGSFPPQSYVIQRLEADADIRPNADWQLFVQLEDDRAFGKTFITPADEDVLDLEQAFITYMTPFLGGELKVRVGRQEMAFDLQRFVSVRDGPNVRQAFDAVWADWESKPWRIIPFWSEPVQYKPTPPFNDFSNGAFQYGGFRVERDDIGPGKLSAYISEYYLANAQSLFASGLEHLNILDVHYAGKAEGFDWDLETMGQLGSFGPKEARALAIGSIVGYTFQNAAWQPRLGLQFDLATGTSHPNSNVISTFNPLFPNGYYFNLSGYSTYANIIHLKPSLTVTPASKLTILAAVAGQWRETTADAVYTIPNIPIPGTAGKGGLWTALYQEGRVDYAFNANLTGAVEVDHYNVGEAIRKAGGRDSTYVGVQLQFGW
jgi:hypothetical protein